MWLLAGPIKCNWPSVTLWSVFQYPVTYELVFGQPPRKTVFPGVTTCPVMEEDILDIVEEGRHYMYLGRDWVEFM